MRSSSLAAQHSLCMRATSTHSTTCDQLQLSLVLVRCFDNTQASNHQGSLDSFFCSLSWLRNACTSSTCTSRQSGRSHCMQGDLMCSTAPSLTFAQSCVADQQCTGTHISLSHKHPAYPALSNTAHQRAQRHALTANADRDRSAYSASPCHSVHKKVTRHGKTIHCLKCVVSEPNSKSARQPAHQTKKEYYNTLKDKDPAPDRLRWRCM